MPHLLHIDSSVQGERSVSRELTHRAAAGWLAANPGGTVTYRDLAANPLPHLDSAAAAARYVPVDQFTAGQAAGYAVSEELIGEVKAADTVILGLPLYNFGPPSQLKSWVDHLIFPGLSVDFATGDGLLSGRRFVVLAARGGGYGEGTPRHGWDHASTWITHGVSLTGLEPEVIAAELTLADVNPAMAELRPLAVESLQAAHAAIDALWAPVTV
jgi:FMN-dependent NADH-azoreductase